MAMEETWSVGNYVNNGNSIPTLMRSLTDPAILATKFWYQVADL